MHLSLLNMLIWHGLFGHSWKGTACFLRIKLSPLWNKLHITKWSVVFPSHVQQQSWSILLSKKFYIHSRVANTATQWGAWPLSPCSGWEDWQVAGRSRQSIPCIAQERVSWRHVPTQGAWVDVEIFTLTDDTTKSLLDCWSCLLFLNLPSMIPVSRWLTMLKSVRKFPKIKTE